MEGLSQTTYTHCLACFDRKATCILPTVPTLSHSIPLYPCPYDTTGMGWDSRCSRLLFFFPFSFCSPCFFHCHCHLLFLFLFLGCLDDPLGSRSSPFLLPIASCTQQLLFAIRLFDYSTCLCYLLFFFAVCSFFVSSSTLVFKTDYPLFVLLCRRAMSMPFLSSPPFNTLHVLSYMCVLTGGVGRR